MNERRSGERVSGSRSPSRKDGGGGARRPLHERLRALSVRRPAVRPIEPGHRWYPRHLHEDQEKEARRLRIPVAIEHVATGIAMVLVPGGTYLMGAGPDDDDADLDEAPRHEVRTRPFYAGIGPVLREQWQRLMERDPSVHRGAVLPVEGVSWNAVRDFLEKANAGQRRAGLRLPSEAEWERAARGGKETRYWWGDGWTRELANGKEGGPGQTSEVGLHPANPYGLLDVLGNVWEWCEDPWHRTYEGAPKDGRPWPGNAGRRVVRGGSWNDVPKRLRVSSRDRDDEDGSYDVVGFRVFRDARFRGTESTAAP